MPLADPCHYCDFGDHVIAACTWFYLIERFEEDCCLCCEACIRLPQHADVRAQLIELGRYELDVKRAH
jgi:hypothetical protein